MRENSLRNIPSPVHETMGEVSWTELTRTPDSDSSAFSVEGSHLNGNASPGQSAEWTNEKHNAYIGFLEASFIQQLHGSTGLGGWCSQEHIWGAFSSKALSANTCSSFGQLMVLRDGCWRKIKSEGNEPLYDNACVNSHGGIKNPWIRRFTSIGKHRTATTFHSQKHSMLCDEGFSFGEDMNFSCEPAGTLEQHLDCLQNVVGSTAEVSDQNFVDEDQGDRSCFRPMTKRLRTAAVDASSDDQVVPIEKLHVPNVSTVNRASSEREELSHPENFTSPRSDMHYFLRGSEVASEAQPCIN